MKTVSTVCDDKKEIIHEVIEVVSTLEREDIAEIIGYARCAQKLRSIRDKEPDSA